MNSDLVRQLNAERVKMLRECGAQFDLNRIPTEQLAALVEFYQETQQTVLAEQTLARGLQIDNLDVTIRADLLLQGTRSALRRPKQDYAKAETYSDMLDRLPETVFEQKVLAHNALNNYFRGDDIDAGIIKHSTWMIGAARKATPELRKKQGNNFIAGYVNLAEVLAGQGENDKALELLRRAMTEMEDVPRAVDRVKPVIARYELVGKPAAEIKAAAWLNRGGVSTPIDLKGKVTLFQFTAHWCGPCKESYPGMKRLEERFKKSGRYQLVFYTRTYGYFGSERNLSREQEIERDKKYFGGYGFTHPIAIGSPSATEEDPVEKAYGLGGIPQIHIIDTKGSLRLIMVGYDDANEEKLVAFIEGILKEK
jgi:thiol-disulfide isomerase/thioredoxin